MGLWLFYTSSNIVRSCACNSWSRSCMVGLLVIICNWACYAAILIRQILWNMGLTFFDLLYHSWILFRHLAKGYMWKTSNSLFLVWHLQEEVINLFYQMPLFFCLPQGLIYSDFNFENTVEGIPLLILIYHMDNILTLHLFLLRRRTYGYV
jgi:hypothetical protein